MRKKLLFFGLAMLTVFGVRSQDTTDVRPVVFPFWMAKEIALDLAEKERLEETAEITSIQLFKYHGLVEGLERNLNSVELQMELIRKKNELLEGELVLEGERRPKNPNLVWVLRMIGALGVGYFIGDF